MVILFHDLPVLALFPPLQLVYQVLLLFSPGLELLRDFYFPFFERSPDRARSGLLEAYEGHLRDRESRFPQGVILERVG